MKSICLFFLLSGWLSANSQAIGIFAGRNLFPADYLAIKYFHPSNYPIQLTAQIFLERSKRNSLRYHSYGVIVSLDYASRQETFHNSSLNYRLGLGTILQVEHEPWILNGRENLNKPAFGLTGEAAGEWDISSAFSLSAFVQQRWLLKQVLGNRQFLIGVGLIYRLNNEY